MTKDKNVTIKFTSETKNVESGIQKVTSELNKLSKNKALTSMSRLGSAVTGLIGTFTTATKIIKAVSQEISELSKAANVQKDAEERLAVAAKNNPYLDDYAVSKLKAFASELQNVGEIGDEELLPMMAELAASGRTYTEIQNIMSAALDASATGMISMESAVQSLNMSYSGSVGTMGKLLPTLKNLTEEELKNGAAIDEVKKAYGGMAEATANTDAQLANAFGDLKERIGGLLNKVIVPLQKALLFTVNSVNTLWDKFKEISGLGEVVEATTLDSKLIQAQTELDGLLAKLDETKAKYQELEQSVTGNVDKIAKIEADLQKARERGNKAAVAQLEIALKLAKQSVEENKNNEATVKAVQDATKAREEESAVIESQIQAKKEEIKAIQEEINAQKSAEQLQKEIEARDKLRSEYDATIAAKEKEIALRRSAGEQISKEAEAQEMYNTAFSAYIKMMSNPAFSGNSGNYKHEVEARKAIAAYAEAANFDDVKNEMQTLTEEAQKFVGVFKETPLSGEIEKSIQKLKEMQASTQEGSEEWEYYNAKIKELTGLLDVVKLKEAEIAESSYTSDLQKWAQVHEKKLEVVSNFASKYAEIMSSITDMVKTQAENEASVKQAALEKQLAAGEISEEEYAERKEEIEKEAAKKTYEIQMWEWSANLLNIGAQTALAVVSALANSGNPYVGIAMAALVGTLGAVQLATAIANKPIPPSFATGGVVGGFQGASMGGDNTYAHVRNGEMILNAKQQKAMFDQLNGYSGNAGSLTNNVVVKNYAAGNVAVTQVPKSDGFELVIKETVRKQLAAGDYSSQLKTAQTKIDGIRYV